MQASSEGSEHRLAVYGSLAPGRKNHWVLEGMPGSWSPGVVRGELHPYGWGATEGYPAMTYDEKGPQVDVQVFESNALPDHWQRIDEFEGVQYVRTLVPVAMADGRNLLCNIYELNRGLLAARGSGQ
jgi:gamma-glutamylcyclotransferase (GGCT)/AIG2-like uncharacterized protein YtfP